MTKITGNTQYRAYQIEPDSIRQADRAVELSFSSELPVFMPEAGYVEILDHSKESIRMGTIQNAAPLLNLHDARQQIGVIEDAYIDAGRRGRAVVRFSKNADANNIYSDVLDGIRKNVSVGYNTYRLVSEDDNESGQSVYRAVDWEPMEISIVPIGKDGSIGVGRGASNTEHEIQIIEDEVLICRKKKIFNIQVNL